jgi:hypothetical protein
VEVVGKTGTVAEGSLRSLKAKQDLLSLLISNEQTRLMVWLFPLDYGKKHHFTSGQHSKTLTDVSLHLHQHDFFFSPCARLPSQHTSKQRGMRILLLLYIFPNGSKTSA